MNILHYTLGFAPYRSGGLIKYARDLMIEQKGEGHQVAAFYPSGTNIFKGKCSVVYVNNKDGIEIFEMLNPLPVPLYYGIKSPHAMMNEKNVNKKSFNRMFDKVKPDVLHIHTLMGLPKAYLEMTHARGIKIVYTSHDYFGLCPKVNFINNKGELCRGTCADCCAMCNVEAKPVWFLKLRNWKCLVPFKNMARRIII